MVDRCQHLVRAVCCATPPRNWPTNWPRRPSYAPGPSGNTAQTAQGLAAGHRPLPADGSPPATGSGSPSPAGSGAGRTAATGTRRRRPTADQRLAAVQSCLDGIKPDQKELLDLIHHQGLSTEDSAEILGIKPAACRQRLSRLQRLVRSCAEERIGSPRDQTRRPERRSTPAGRPGGCKW